MKTLPLLVCSLGLAVASLLTTAAQAQEAKPGNAAAARSKVAMCIGCHGIEGYRASFPEVHRVPMISGQNAKYIASALHAYQKGERKHPTMRGIAASLTEQDIADLSVYYETNGKGVAPHAAREGQASPEVQALLKRGNCVSCHGANLNKPIDAYPKLAGQYEDYVLVALKSYQNDKAGPVGRANPIMVAQAKLFTLPELKLLAHYIGGLPSDLKTVHPSEFR